MFFWEEKQSEGARKREWAKRTKLKRQGDVVMFSIKLCGALALAPQLLFAPKAISKGEGKKARYVGWSAMENKMTMK